MKSLFSKSYRVYCLCGDGESAEGSVWEAMAFASQYKLDNLVNIVDVNRLGQSEPTMYQHDVDVYRRRIEAFGWHVQVVDGHDVQAIVNALNVAATVKGQPCCLVAKTHKGRYFPSKLFFLIIILRVTKQLKNYNSNRKGIDDDPNWHGKPLGKNTEAVINAVRGLIANKTDKLAYELLPIKAPTTTVPAVDISNIQLATPPSKIYFIFIY